VDDCGGDLNVDKSFGKGGTGGTCSDSKTSLVETRAAARSFKDATSLEWAETSLPALLRRALRDSRCELAETEVRLVPTDILPESRELTVGVEVYIVEEVDTRLGATRLERFFVVVNGLSGDCEPG
jgi:hypothetical protein